LQEWTSTTINVNARGGLMPRQNVVSREYKVMLRTDRFTGGAGRLLARANEFFAQFAAAAAPITVGTHGEFEAGGKQRRIRFWDTTSQHLNALGYICRQREKLTDEEREITLKFRHRDRHVSQDRDMGAARGVPAKTKFEEDIKKPFVSLYSFSTTAEVEDERPFPRLGDVGSLFPDLRDRIRADDADRAMVAVNDVVVRELVFEGPVISLDRAPKSDAECALIVWYRIDSDPERPVAVEFSYRYGDRNEEYGGAMAARAFDAFTVLQRNLDQWVNPTDLTKTALVYGKGDGD